MVTRGMRTVSKSASNGDTSCNGTLRRGAPIGLLLDEGLIEQVGNALAFNGRDDGLPGNMPATQAQN